MKVIRDDICLVNIEDLIRKSGPYLDLDKYEYQDGEFAIVRDDEGIKYIKDRDDILDYDDIKDLKDEDIDKKIAKEEKNLDSLGNIYLMLSISDRNKFWKDNYNREKYDKSIAIIESLRNYKNNRDLIDDMIRIKLKSVIKTKSLT